MHLSCPLIICALSISPFANAYSDARHQTSDLYIRDAYHDAYPELHFEKRDIYQRAGMQPSIGSHLISSLRRRKQEGPSPTPSPPRRGSSSSGNSPPGSIGPNNAHRPASDMPLGYDPWSAGFGVNRPVTPPPQWPRPPRNTRPGTGGRSASGTLNRPPQPVLMSVTGPFRPANVDFLSPFSETYGRGASEPRPSSNLNQLSPFSGTYNQVPPRAGGANANPRRSPRGRRSQIPDAHGHYLMPRGKKSKKKFNAPAQGPSSQGPSMEGLSISTPGTAGSSDDGTALPPQPPPSPMSIPLNRPQSPDPPAVQRSASGSSPRSGGSLTLPPFSPSSANHVLNRHNAPPFLPQDPILRSYVSVMIPQNAQRVPGTFGEAERGREPVRSRNSQFRSNTGSVSSPRWQRD